MPSDRLTWAASVLAPQPAERLLEIGCGHGNLVSLLAEHVPATQITAIDRSAKMIAMARRRTPSATFATTSLADYKPAAQFDKVCSVNVSLFWTPPGSQIPHAIDLLTPTGSLYVFHQPPYPEKNAEVEEVTTRLLRAHGLTVHEVLSHPMNPAPTICIRASR